MNKSISLIALTLILASQALNAKEDRVEVVHAKTLTTILRDKHTTMAKFRETSDQLALILASKAAEFLPKEEFDIETQLAPTKGYDFKNNLIVVTILRSGNALLFPFLKFFKRAQVGTIGLERDEETAIAFEYYEKFPPISEDANIIVVDPMLATGGSATHTIQALIAKGAKEENIMFVGVIAATEGIRRVKADFPNIHKIIVAEIDEKLNDQKFIVPGLGDYGDRYFGT